MNIRVQRRNGEMLTINVASPLEITNDTGRPDDRKQPFTHLHSANGMDHYFTQDGYYDGWGASLDYIQRLSCRGGGCSE
jgi:hypothetical protein